MTAATAAPPAEPASPPRAPGSGTATVPPARPGPLRRLRAMRPPTPPKSLVIVLLWLGAVAVGLGAVMYGFGPIFQERDQRRLLEQYRLELEQAAGAGPVGEEGGQAAPQPGAPVGILEIGSIRVQQVVVEGVEPSQTQVGPGHLPGTAGLGQPGNSVVVARRTAFGRPFGDLRQVDIGDAVVVTTTQGQSVYEVESVARITLAPAADADSPLAVPTGGAPADDAEAVADPMELFGPTDGDQLTMVTSASRNPANSSTATVVIASMRTDPFAPTAQNGRDPDVYGASPENGAAASIVLALVAYGLAMGLAIVLYRHLPLRIAYLLSAPAIVAATVVAAETFSRALPAWL